MNKNQRVVRLEEDPETGDLILPFPDDMLDELGWQEGDTLEWLEEDNQFVLRKKQ